MLYLSIYLAFRVCSVPDASGCCEFVQVTMAVLLRHWWLRCHWSSRARSPMTTAAVSSSVHCRTLCTALNSSRMDQSASLSLFNPFNASCSMLLFEGFSAILVSPTIFNFWHSGALVLCPERQSARMSVITNSGLDLNGKVWSLDRIGGERVRQFVSFHCAAVN